MRYIWNTTIDDYIEILERAKAAGVKPGESMEEIINEYMKEKSKKPLATGLSKEELLTELTNNGKKIMHIEHDEEDGEQHISFIKKKEDDEKTK